MSTPLRLVSDYLRRVPHNIVVSLGLVMLFWTPAVTGQFMVGPTAFSMSVAYLFSAFAFTSLVTRPVFYLPVSRRDIWIAQWLMSTVVATTVTTGGRILAILLHYRDGIRLADGSTGVLAALELVSLSAVLDFAYGGSFPASIWLMRLVTRKTGSRVVANVSFALMCVWFAGGLFWSFLLRRYLPLSWESLAGAHGVVLLVGVGLAIGASFYVPRIAPRGAPARPTGSRTDAAGTPRSRVTFEGLRLLVVREVAVNTAMVAAGYLALLGLQAITLLAADPQLAADALRPRPIADARFVAGVVPFPAAIVLVLVCFRNGLQPHIRHLRTMPMSGWQLNVFLLFIATVSVALVSTALTWLLAWRPPHPDDLRTLVALSGLAALTQSLQLRLRQAWSIGAFGVILIVALAADLLSAVPGSAQFVNPVAFGLAGVVIAALMNHRWLTRSAMTYRPSVDFKLIAAD